uniref:Reverse transcriptase domain-containing protein n=1 Tax=Strigamia maritima TaxID=126957 RepID=T1ILV9_STRMM
MDYILTNDLDSITRMFVDERVDSDHLPIVFSLFVELDRETGKQAQSHGKWIWNSKLAANFTAKIDNWVEEFQGNPQVGLSELPTVMTKIARDCGLKQVLIGREPKSWFDKECGCLRREVKQKLRKFRRSCLLDDRVDYILAKKHLRALYRLKKKQRDKDIWDRVKKSADANQFWTEIKKFTRRKQIVGQNIADADWNEHFMNLLGGTDAKPPRDDLGVIEDFIYAGDEMLDGDFSFAEFSAQIAKLKNNKSPGPDQLINEFLKALSSGPRRRLLGWINEMWRQQAWLPQWRVGIICPIFKAGDASLPSNYRGITLLNGIYKVIIAMMAKRISSWLEENHKIKESQAAFRRGYSTRDHLFMLNSLIENRFKKKGKLYVLFLDFKVAFDSIDRTKLFEQIWKIGIRGHVWQCFLRSRRFMRKLVVV